MITVMMQPGRKETKRKSKLISVNLMCLTIYNEYYNVNVKI